MSQPIQMGSRLRDYLKPFLRVMPDSHDRKKFLELCKGLIQCQKAVLSEAARSVLRRRGKSKGTYYYRARIDDWVKKMSHFLADLK